MKEKEVKFLKMNFIRKNILLMEPYKVGKQSSDEVIRLNSNESPYPSPKFVIDAIYNELIKNNLNYYPDNQANSVRESASKVFGINKRKIIIGNGSTSILQTIFTTFLDKNDIATIVTPTFGLYEKLITIQNAKVKKITYCEDNSLPFNRLLKVKTKILVLANPNTPTGNAIPIEKIERLVEQSNNIVIIDEAYSDFITDSTIPLVNKFDNLIVVKTLSKIHSLAGMRIGFGFSSSQIIENLFKVMPVCNVNILSQVAAKSVFDNWDYFKLYLQEIKETRDDTISRLKKIGFEINQSSTNFILVKVPKNFITALEWKNKLEKNDILVRHFPNIFDDCLRITIGTPSDMKKLINIMIKIRGCI